MNWRRRPYWAFAAQLLRSWMFLSHRSAGRAPNLSRASQIPRRSHDLPVIAYEDTRPLLAGRQQRTLGSTSHAVSLEAIPEPTPQFSEAENFAVEMLRHQRATESSLLRLMELLPVTMRPFQADGDHASEVNSGAFST